MSERVKFRKSHVDKMVAAQRHFDSFKHSADIAGRDRAAAVIGGLWRNASDEERHAFRAQCGPDGRVK